MRLGPLFLHLLHPPQRIAALTVEHRQFPLDTRHFVLRFGDVLPISASRATGIFLLVLVAFYVLGSVMKLKPWHIGRFTVVYPSLHVTLSQLAVGTCELLGAAGIISVTMSEENRLPSLKRHADA